jgi:hypothetical protein
MGNPVLHPPCAARSKGVLQKGAGAPFPAYLAACRVRGLCRRGLGRGGAAGGERAGGPAVRTSPSRRRQERVVAGTAWQVGGALDGHHQLRVRRHAGQQALDLWHGAGCVAERVHRPLELPRLVHSTHPPTHVPTHVPPHTYTPHCTHDLARPAQRPVGLQQARNERKVDLELGQRHVVHHVVGAELA